MWSVSHLISEIWDVMQPCDILVMYIICKSDLALHYAGWSGAVIGYLRILTIIPEIIVAAYWLLPNPTSVGHLSMVVVP